jgi:hypothetical protein
MPMRRWTARKSRSDGARSGRNWGRGYTFSSADRAPDTLTPVRTDGRLPGTTSVAGWSRKTYKQSSPMLKQFRFNIGGLVSLRDTTPEGTERDYLVEACR